MWDFAKDVFNKISLSNKWFYFSIIIWIFLFILAIIILYLGVNNYNIVLTWDNLMFITAWLFFSGLILIITPMYFGIKNRELDIQNIEAINDIQQINFISVLKELQNKFSDKDFLTPSRLVKTFRNWKDVFKINNSNNTTIVAVIEDDWEIQNFYIWSRDEEHKTKLKKIVENKENQKVNKEEIDKWWYWNEHFVFQDPLDLCKDWKYKEAIDFLIDILENAKIIK